MPWEHFSHAADIGVRGIGATREEAFEQAALALTAVVTDPSRIDGKRAVEIAREAPDEELLLADWLNALVYEMVTLKMVFVRFSVQLDPGKLHATAWGEPIDAARHHVAVEVKGATYTELAVRQRNDGSWVAQCVVDV